MTRWDATRAAAAAAAILCGASCWAAAETLEARLTLCASCHGQGGNSALSGIPSLAGQPKTFIETQLIMFREGVRASPQMQPFAKGLSDADVVALATHFAASTVAPNPAPADGALSGRGRELAQKLHCGSCHLPDFRGQAQMARLAGQREDYLVEAMRAYRDNRRTGDTTMAAVLYGVSDADIGALAHFLSHER